MRQENSKAMPKQVIGGRHYWFLAKAIDTNEYFVIKCRHLSHLKRQLILHHYTGLQLFDQITGQPYGLTFSCRPMTIRDFVYVQKALA